jgi:hypothetical protein
MNQTTIEPGNQLSEVISRINALTQQSHLVQAPVEDNIPRLTETYAGNLPLKFIDAASATLPTLDNVVLPTGGEEGTVENPSQNHHSGLNETESHQALTADQQQRLLNDMEPVIKAAVKKAILGELVVIERALRTTIEQDIMDALKKRIELGQF